MSEDSLTFGVAVAARKLDVSEQWLRVNAANGNVPSLKIGRYRRFTDALIAEYLERCRQDTAAPFAQSAASRARRRTA